LLFFIIFFPFHCFFPVRCVNTAVVGQSPALVEVCLRAKDVVPYAPYELTGEGRAELDGNEVSEVREGNLKKCAELGS
jgi:hypothetical protein